MTDIKEKFSNLIEEQNLKISGGPFVVKNFLKNVEDYLNKDLRNKMDTLLEKPEEMMNEIKEF